MLAVNNLYRTTKFNEMEETKQLDIFLFPMLKNCGETFCFSANSREDMEDILPKNTFAPGY